VNASKWSVQIQPPGGGMPEDLLYFQDFATTLTFAKAFKGRASGAILNVHIPGRATYMQRQQLVASGATPIPHPN
jgi:hypothetical protein